MTDVDYAKEQSKKQREQIRKILESNGRLLSYDSGDIKENIIELMHEDLELYKMTDMDYAKEIRKQLNILNELIKEAEDSGLDIVIWQYGKHAEHELQAKITKTVEL